MIKNRDLIYPRINNFDFLLNQNFEDAKKMYSNIRVINEDGKNLIVTWDCCLTRINVKTKDNIIIKIVGIY